MRTRFSVITLCCRLVNYPPITNKYLTLLVSASPIAISIILRSSFNKSDTFVNLLFPFFNRPCHILLLNNLFIRIQEALCLPTFIVNFKNRQQQGMSRLAIPIDNTWNGVIRLQLIGMYHNPSYGVDHLLVLVTCIRICEANPGIWPPFGYMRQWTR